MSERIRRALLSVSDKAGLAPFASALAARGVELISTGGTAAALAAAGLRVTPIDAVTGFPEILDGRVKTLHPKVHGGLLGVRTDAAHRAQMDSHGITPIDLVCVNLYPFEQTIARVGCTRDEAIEQIDIGGPSMIRSAAKNHAFVTVVTDPAQYEAVLADLSAHDGATGEALRARLARKAFALTARYDAAIAAYLAGDGDMFPAVYAPAFIKTMGLRYGENPHQHAALYRDASGSTHGIAQARQLHGKELSYNNILDAAAALALAQALRRVEPDACGAVIVKHGNPCGAAAARTPRQAVELAIAGDPLAAYGGILAINTPFDATAAERLQGKDVFLEVIVAPRFEPAALDSLRARWANVRLLDVGESNSTGRFESRSIAGGLLVQSVDDRVARADEFVHRAGPPASDSALRVARFLEPVCRSLMSNAVCLGIEDGGGVRLAGAGAGQMDRVTACRLACEKAGVKATGAVAFSDAFFPFADGPEILIAAGVTTMVHPGGSKRDEDTFALCSSRSVTCLTTGLRHFRH
ncbi:MAG: bifunctional purine biosynthesis protein PurH [Phycisphaerae bacterium]|nr:MAG: bifunctional purine biosynthesis protein PurH [Phycisphaerae bacterium]